jgi:hypothetical protein
MKRIPKIFLYILAIALGFSLRQVMAQDITISPKVCYFSDGELVKVSITSKEIAFSTNNSDCPTKLLVTSSNVVLQQSTPLMYQPFVVTNNKIEMEIDSWGLFSEGFYKLTVGAGEPCAYKCDSCI